MISTLFQEAANAYHTDRNIFRADTSRPRSFSNYRSFEAITRDLPYQLQRDSNLPRNQYLIEGSTGAGTFADVPWICVFNSAITTTAQNGYYLVYLFRADMQGVYLSLNQGYTQYRNAFGTKLARANIAENANRCRRLLRSISDYSTERIDLRATTELGRGYEAGNICSRYYSFGDFPDNVTILDDFRNFIGLYRELQGLVGNNILDIQAPITEDEYQEDIQTGTEIQLSSGPIERGQQVPSSGSTSWQRGRNMAFTALRNADFKCENDEAHTTFVSARNSRQFMEAHHLIPVEFQGDFLFSIDVPENIISLCPNCHRSFHHAKNDYKRGLLRRFLTLRRDQLLQRGIMIEEETLFNYYKSNKLELSIP